MAGYLSIPFSLVATNGISAKAAFFASSSVSLLYGFPGSDAANEFIDCRSGRVWLVLRWFSDRQ